MHGPPSEQTQWTLRANGASKDSHNARIELNANSDSGTQVLAVLANS